MIESDDSLQIIDATLHVYVGLEGSQILITGYGVMKRVLDALGDWSNEDWRLNDKGWCGQIAVIAKIFEYDCITINKSIAYNM